jgi:hypothetical protein
MIKIGRELTQEKGLMKNRNQRQWPNWPYSD